MTSRYTVEKGETARDVARRFTGDPSRYRDLIPMNPHLQTVTGQMGSPEFDPRDWHDGMSLKIPERWVQGGRMHGPGSVGVARSKSTPGPTFTTMPSFSQTPTFNRTHASRTSLSVPSSSMFTGLWSSQTPFWPGSWLAYVSQRVAAFNGASVPEVQQWLRLWPHPNAFWEDAENYGKRSTNGPGPRMHFAPEGVWFADPKHIQVLGDAASMMTQGIGPEHEWTRTLFGSTGARSNRVVKKFAPNPYMKRANPYMKRAGLAGPRGMVGDDQDIGKKEEMEGGGGTSTCSPGAISDVKDYRYVVRSEDGWPANFAQAWFESMGEGARYTTKAVTDLLKANHDHPVGFKREGAVCNFKNFYDGMCLKIPASWPNPTPDSVYASRIFESDCSTPYKGSAGGGGTGPGTQGETGIDPQSWLGDGDSSTLLLVLAAAAAIGGGILLYNSQKKKRR